MITTTYNSRAIRKTNKHASTSKFGFYVLKVEYFMKRFFALIIIANIILVGVIYAELFMPSNSKAVMSTLSEQVSVGPATQAFVEEVKTVNLSPVITGKVNRAPLTASGRSISMAGDNFQVFEYSDSNTAKKEAGLLAQKYATSSHASEWLNDVHIYQRDKLVIYYLGSNQKIINSLSQGVGDNVQVMGTSAFRPDNYVSVVSKQGEYYK
ncbi:MAG: hypothetical protein WCG97_01900 [bacterium]